MSWEEAEQRIQEAAKQQSKSLNLSGLQLTEIPDAIRELSNLQELDLGHNRLATIPDTIGKLSNLQELDLRNNQLTTIPDTIGKLSNLQELDLRNNQLTTIPDAIGQLSNLKELTLHDNQLASLPDAIGQLANLQEIYLGKNRLEMLPDEIGQLANLNKIQLFDNALTAIPNPIGQLANLKVLNLSGNQLTSIPDTIGQLINLQTLNLSDNQLTSVRGSTTQLANLRELYLHGNDLLKIPAEVLGPTYRDAINNQVELAKPQDILEYLFRIQEKAQPLNEAKLILVGYGAVGKTSLVNRLVHQTFDAGETKTEGIQITNWPLCLNGNEKVKLNVWDFGGQEIMHSTHQFFLTERSLYLLVLNGRQGHEDADAEYWLELIQSFGGNSPVIVVLNKINEHPFDVNRSGLKQKFPNIKDFIRTDCATGQGLDELRQVVKRETDHLEHLRDPFPASWFTIKQRLADMQENYISFERYRSICSQNKESNIDSQDSLAVHLHSLGIALNYKEDPRLRDTNILNPLWVTNGIYKILNAHDLADHKGELDIGSLTKLLDPQNYPRERHGFLMELMRKFELCFPFQNSQNCYLIPDLLDKQQPPEAENFILKDCLNFRYEYPILPEGLLPRFIVRSHILSENPLRWRTGVILDFEGNRALVKADRQDRSVTISINGPQHKRRELLGIIRYDFEHIHNNFKFKPEEKVPIPKHPQLTLSYQELLVMEQQGLTELPKVIDGEVIQIDIKELLNGIDLDKQPKDLKGVEHPSKALKLFYSYSHKDESLRDQLEVRLKLLQRNGLIQNWHDRKIIPGADWKNELDRNLEQADIILLLVSPDFIASDYCYEIEMSRARDRHDAKEAILLPILIRPLDWNSASFSDIQALPSDLKPVTKWTDRDDAWLDVMQGIKQVIQSIQKH